MHKAVLAVLASLSVAAIGALGACAVERAEGRRVPSSMRRQHEGDALRLRPRGSLVFVSEREGSAQVFTIAPGETTPHPVGRVPGSGFIAPLGPADELLVISSTGHDAGAREQLQRLDGGRFVPLGPASRFVRNPSWVPDGASVVFESDQNGFRNLFRIGLADDQPEQLTHCEHGCFEPAVSPDGHLVAYASPDSGDGEVYALDLATGNSQRLTWSKGTDKSPAWSPDGSRIAFLSNRHGAPRVHVMGHDGSKPRALRESVEADLFGERDIAWSPDGLLVAFVAQRQGRAGLRVVRVADGAIMSASDGAWLDQSPSFSADGEHVAFTSDRDGNPDLYVMRTDGSSLRRVTSHRAADWLPRWTH